MSPVEVGVLASVALALALGYLGFCAGAFWAVTRWEYRPGKEWRR